MLPKRQRLTSSGVERVLKKPSRGKEGLFRYSWKTNRVGYPRCAVVVTKGENIGSVQRNRIRRVAYAALGEALGGKTFAGDIVLFIRSSAGKVSKEAVSGDMAKLVKAVGEGLGMAESAEKVD